MDLLFIMCIYYFKMRYDIFTFGIPVTLVSETKINKQLTKRHEKSACGSGIEK